MDLAGTVSRTARLRAPLRSSRRRSASRSGGFRRWWPWKGKTACTPAPEASRSAPTLILSSVDVFSGGKTSKLSNLSSNRGTMKRTNRVVSIDVYCTSCGAGGACRARRRARWHRGHRGRGLSRSERRPRRSAAGRIRSSRPKRVPDVDQMCRLLIVPLCRDSGRSESLVFITPFQLYVWE